jgi:translocation and assembly module TamB
VGIVDGRFDVTATRAADHHGIDVLVDVPRMHVQLPTAASHDVQSLGGMDAIDVGVRSSANEFVPVMLDASSDTPSEAGNADRTPVKVTLHLGHDVEVQRGTDLDMRLEGAPTLLLGSGEPRATGRIELARGTLDVEGKRFDIQGDSTVTFVGDDPTNPQVVLTAGWTAPDGTEVFADFIGPLKTAKVTLRSQPSRTKSEILALILFGTTDEQAPAGSASPQATGAVGAAGGAATAPINRALGGVNHMLDNFGLAGGISTKIDTSTTNPRPEVELQIARDISLQIAWVLGVPPPGSNPDTTLLTLNWRFLRQWSLVTTVGDAGTSIVDVIWQRRY